MGRKAKILIVDDEAEICRFSKSLLERTGEFEVTVSTSPVEAVALARGNPPELIILDVNMAEMDGGDVARVLGGFENTKDIPILFVTALLRKEEECPGFRASHYYMAKPVRPEELIEKVKLLLRLSKS